jgi:hypothetical protein
MGSRRCGRGPTESGRIEIPAAFCEFSRLCRAENFRRGSAGAMMRPWRDRLCRAPSWKLDRGRERLGSRADPTAPRLSSRRSTASRNGLAKSRFFRHFVSFQGFARRKISPVAQLWLVVLAGREPESHGQPRAPGRQILWVRGFRAHTIFAPRFNLFRLLRRHLRATPFCRQPLAPRSRDRRLTWPNTTTPPIAWRPDGVSPVRTLASARRGAKVIAVIRKLCCPSCARSATREMNRVDLKTLAWILFSRNRFLINNYDYAWYILDRRRGEPLLPLRGRGMDAPA